MALERRHVAAGGGALALFVLVQLGTLALVAPFDAPAYRFVEDTGDPTNSLAYVLFLLVVTGAMLLVIRYDVRWLLRLTIVGASASLAWYVLEVVARPLAVAAGVESALLGLAGAGLVAAGLLFYPEWYVIDAAGVLMGASGAALLGVNFGVLPTVVLLVVLAVYDAVSVYGTEHMLTLASGVMELRLPVVLVVPLTLSYSLLEDDLPDPTADDGREGEDDGEPSGGDETSDGEHGGSDVAGDSDAAATADADASGDEPEGSERDAVFVGLGDAVMPTIMVASAATFSPAAALAVPAVTVNLPALAAAVGSLGGLLALVWMVLKGRAHAGLPLLNGGAILGYLAGSLAAGVSLLDALGLAPYV